MELTRAKQLLLSF